MGIELEVRTQGVIFTPAATAIWDREITRALEIIIMNLKNKIVLATPAYTGTLQNSVTAEQRGTGFNRQGVVGTPSKYAWVIEKGRLPGSFPNIDAVKTWAKRKLGVPEGPALDRTAYLICRAIYQKGTKGVKMFEKTFESERARILKMLDEAVARVTKRLNGGAA